MFQRQPNRVYILDDPIMQIHANPFAFFQYG